MLMRARLALPVFAAVLTNAGIAHAEVGVFQRPAFEDFRLRLDMSPVREPGMAASIQERGIVVRNVGWSGDGESSEYTYTLVDAAFELKWRFLRASIGFDSYLETPAPKPVFDIALGHSFDRLDLGLRVQWMSGVEHAETATRGFREPIHAAGTAFAAYCFSATFCLETEGGLEFVQGEGSGERNVDIEVDIFAYPRASWQLLPEFGFALGARIVLVGKLYRHQFLPRVEVAYSYELNEVLTLDLGLALTYGYTSELGSSSYSVFRGSAGFAILY